MAGAKKDKPDARKPARRPAATAPRPEPDNGPRVPVVVSLGDRDIPQIEQLSRRLESTGMEVDHVMPILGQITGQIQESKIPAIEKLEGVKAVSRQRTLRAL